MARSRHTPPRTLKEFLLLALRDRGGWAFTATVFAGYASAVLSPQWAAISARAPLLIALGVVFWLAGTLGFEYISLKSSRTLTTGYFVVMVLLCLSIIYLSVSVSFIIIIILPLVAHAVSRLPAGGVVLVCAVLLASYGLTIGLEAGWVIGLQAMISSASGVVFVAVFTKLALNEERARHEVERLASELREANQKLREYAAQVEELATTRERNRIAREIHDGLGHYLTVINMQIQAARAVQAADPAKAGEAMGKAGVMAQEALADVRRSVAALRASPTESKPLAQLLGELVEELRAGGIQAGFAAQGSARPLSPQADLTLYRAAQEALTNVRKHAHASSVAVTLAYAADSVMLTVRDNGVGGDKADGGFGLIGVRERAQLLNGRVTVQTQKGGGFVLTVELPYEARASE